MSLAMLVCALLASPRLLAAPPANTCFAVTSSMVAPDLSALRCGEAPTGYRNGVLWLRMPIASASSREGTLAIQTTRFDQLTVMFEYPDGLGAGQTVSRGAYAENWRLGGQIAFRSRQDRPTVAVWIRIVGLEDHELLHLRIVNGQVAQRQFELTAFAIGAALALLGIAALFNFGLAISLQRTFFLWHGCWSAAVMVWGLVWSQIGLVVLPGIAGTTANRMATVLSCAAIMFASFATASALRHALPKGVIYLLVGLGLSIVALGAASGMPGADLGLFGALLGIGTLSTVTAATVCIAASWKRGYIEARDLAVSWGLPMATLVIVQVADFGNALWGGGSKIVMLYASAFQIVCLTGFATLRLGGLRVERDVAIETGKRLTELAERDPLTGLLNRRGFLVRCAEDFGSRSTTPFGLLLIDVDKFKTVNDQFGHQVGDQVLSMLGQKLLSFEERYACRAARMGGEEFALGISGFAGEALVRFGERVRSELAQCDFGSVAPARRITVSIGIAQGLADGPFEVLYRKADEALYAAKQGGRNRVVSAHIEEGKDRKPAPRYQMN